MSEPTREQKQEAARVRMAELALKFLDRTHNDIAMIRDGLARLAAGDAGAFADIRHLAHRMVGTGATLGFDSISDRAHEIEALAENGQAGEMPRESLQARLAAALGALSEEFSRELERRGRAT